MLPCLSALCYMSVAVPPTKGTEYTSRPYLQLWPSDDLTDRRRQKWCCTSLAPKLWVYVCFSKNTCYLVKTPAMCVLIKTPCYFLPLPWKEPAQASLLVPGGREIPGETWPCWWALANPSLKQSLQLTCASPVYIRWLSWPTADCMKYSKIWFLEPLNLA